MVGLGVWDFFFGWDDHRVVVVVVYIYCSSSSSNRMVMNIFKIMHFFLDDELIAHNKVFFPNDFGGSIEMYTQQ